MSAIQCHACRWWTGRQDAPQLFHEDGKHGNCLHITSAAGQPEGSPVRIYPVSANAWLSTRYDFSCRDWEKSPHKEMKA